MIHSSLPRLYFLHIPKTSGTAFGGWLRRLYDVEKSFPWYDYHQLSGHTLEEMQGFDLYAGHFGRALPDLLDHPVETVTFLRDPLERLASLIHYTLYEVKLDPENKHGKELQAIRESSHPFEGMAEAAPHVPEFQNGQTHELTKTWPLRRYLNSDNQLDLNLATFRDECETPTAGQQLYVAISFLDTLSAVGICEQSQTSLEQFCRVLDLPLENPLQLERTTQGRKGGAWQQDYWFQRLNPDLKRKLETLIELDRELYQHALTRFETEQRAMTKTISLPPE